MVLAYTQMRGPATQQHPSKRIMERNIGNIGNRNVPVTSPLALYIWRSFFLPCSFTRLSHALNLYSHVFPCSFKLLYIDSLPEWWERRLCTLPCSFTRPNLYSAPMLDLPCSFTRRPRRPYWIFSGARSPTFYPLILLFHPARPHNSLGMLCILTVVLSCKVNTGAFLAEHFWKRN